MRNRKIIRDCIVSMLFLVVLTENKVQAQSRAPFWESTANSKKIGIRVLAQDSLGIALDSVKKRSSPWTFGSLLGVTLNGYKTYQIRDSTVILERNGKAITPAFLTLPGLTIGEWKEGQSITFIGALGISKGTDQTAQFNAGLGISFDIFDQESYDAGIALMLLFGSAPDPNADQLASFSNGSKLPKGASLTIDSGLATYFAVGIYWTPHLQ